MKVVALVSGGKDSCYSMILCEHYGHQIVALANLCPPITQIETETVQKGVALNLLRNLLTPYTMTTLDELDSFMFQTVGHNVIDAYSECMGLPLFRYISAITSTG